MIIQSEAEVKALKRIGRVVAQVLKEMLNAVRPGIATWQLDEIGGQLLNKHKARSAPILCYNFPGHTCISINEEVAHGIPGDRIIQPGDVVNIDVSAELGGFYGDTGGTIVVPPKKEKNQNLCQAAKIALERAIEVAVAGQPINKIGKAIEQTADEYGFKPILNLGSHGIGRKLHEPPEFIAGYDKSDDSRLLEKGMVITIEPFISTHLKNVKDSDDGWTLLNARQGRSAQFEHTMIITDKKPILTTILS
ncbi:MAG: type I methionyl aminopeptidase [Pirellulaceae bacterium]|nr:type I methionyl aminopeptidase [Pirellulaceae bacterium]